MISTEAQEWQEIWYKPQSYVTRLNSEASISYYTDRGYTLKPIEEDLGFMRNLVRGIKVEVCPPPDKVEMYVEPLATIHKAFWDEMAEVGWDIYPLFKKNKNGRNYKNRYYKFGKMVQDFIVRFYWEELDYKDHNPQTWAKLLNDILDIFRIACKNKEQAEERIEQIRGLKNGFQSK